MVILSLSAPEDQMRAFEEGLQARGWIHNTTVNLEHRTAAGRRDALMRLAAEAASLSPNVIVAVGTKAAIAAQKSTIAIPIVAVTGDMDSAGLVKNFSQPEGNVTGFSFFTLELMTPHHRVTQGSVIADIGVAEVRMTGSGRSELFESNVTQASSAFL